MKKIPYLTPTEFQFMTVLWNAERPLAVSEILERRVEGTWSKNSVHPLLNSLIEKGFVDVKGLLKVSKVNSRLFSAKISLSDYTAAQVSKVFENDKVKFNIPGFLSNLVGGGDEKVNDELIDELESWINDYNSKNK